MIRKATGLLLVVIALIFSSCDGNPFMSNLFENVDKYELPTLNNKDDILDAAGDDQFLDALSEDPELAEEVISTLEEVVSSTPFSEASASDQEAAIVLADVYLAASDADDTINNVNDLLVDAVNDPSSLDFSEPSDVIGSLFTLDEGLTQAEQEATVSAQLEAFLGAADALEYYGNTMVTDDGLDTNPEVNPGETAATALISGMTQYLIENMVDGTNDLSDSEAIDALTDSIVYGTPIELANDDDLQQASGISAMLEAMLGDGLTKVVDDGVDLSLLGDMGV